MISMLLMEIAMNVVDYGMMGERAITWVFYLIPWEPVFWLPGPIIIGGLKSMGNVVIEYNKREFLSFSFLALYTNLFLIF